MPVMTVAPIFWAKGAIAIVAFVATIPAVRMLAEPLKKILFEQTRDWEPEDLKDLIGYTDVNEVTPQFGRAIVPNQDQEHVVQVRSRVGVIGPRGVKVLLTEFEPAGEFFWVEKVEETHES